MRADWAQNISLLKALVGLMTALIVAGLILFIVGIARTTTELTAPAGAAMETPAAPMTAASFGDVRIAIPEGARLVAFEAAGSRLLLHLETPEGRQSILVVDLESGRRLGRLELEPGP